MSKHKDTRFDKFLKRYLPERALKREQARIGLEFLGKAGGYEGASKAISSFENFVTALSDPDQSIQYDRETLIERSRDYVRNKPIAGAILNRACDHAVGADGLNLQSTIDAKFLGLSRQQAQTWQQGVEAEFRLFAESHESDFARTENFYQKTYSTLHSELEGGDCFSLLVNKPRPGSPYDLKIQTIEAERVSNPDNQSNDETLRFGIERDADGVPVRVHISNRFPLTTRGGAGMTWQAREIFSLKSGRRNILHHYDQVRPDQSRGVPILSTVSEKLLNLSTLSNAELLASVLNSYYVIFITGAKQSTGVARKNPTASESQQSDQTVKMGSGSVITMPDDVEIESFDPNRPSQLFQPFFEAIVAEIGARVGVPKSLILMTFDRSYSASRGEVLLGWVYFLAKRLHIANTFCQPVYEAFLDEAVAKGFITAPGYFSDIRIRKAYCGSAYSQWRGPTMPAIDVLKEAQAEAIKITQSQTRSRKQSANEVDGVDWDTTVQPRLIEEAEKLGKVTNDENP